MVDAASENALHRKYGTDHPKPFFRSEDLYLRAQEVLDEYPIVLSTTFSARNCLSPETIYDYLIMDEASQVSIETGALALSVARNAVIVGDSMQLPNVVTSEARLKLNEIAGQFTIPERYDCARNSFLESVCRTISGAPQTLLKEHYRCHPKIIDFCNRKFYGGNLVIMTRDNGESEVICAVKTVEGNHEHGHVNQREIDVIRKEVLPTLSYETENIGIIAPYNAQVDALRQQIDATVDIATVHKFQGREKDAIVMCTVNNQISDFVDDPNLLNVAVSRAKQKFCLVVTGNKQQKSGNISDLLAYIEYNNFTVAESKIHSIFDYLYKQYTEARMAYLATRKRISEYDSENLTYALIKDILFSHATPRRSVPSAFANADPRFFAARRERTSICRKRPNARRFSDLQQGRQTTRARHRDRRSCLSPPRFPTRGTRQDERPHIGTLRHPLRTPIDRRKQRTGTDRNQIERNFTPELHPAGKITTLIVIQFFCPLEYFLYL